MAVTSRKVPVPSFSHKRPWPPLCGPLGPEAQDQVQISIPVVIPEGGGKRVASHDDAASGGGLLEGAVPEIAEKAGSRGGFDAPEDQIQPAIPVHISPGGTVVEGSADGDPGSGSDFFEGSVPEVSKEQIGADIAPDDVEIRPAVSIKISRCNAADENSLLRQQPSQEAMAVVEARSSGDLREAPGPRPRRGSKNCDG